MLTARRNLPVGFFPFRVTEYKDLATALSILSPGVTYDDDGLAGFQPLSLALATKWYWRVKTWEVDISVSGYHDGTLNPLLPDWTGYSLSVPGDGVTINPSRYGQKNPDGTWASNVHRNYLGQNGMMNSVVDLAPGPPIVPSAIDQKAGTNYKVGEYATQIGYCAALIYNIDASFDPFYDGVTLIDPHGWSVIEKPYSTAPDGAFSAHSRYVGDYPAGNMNIYVPLADFGRASGSLWSNPNTPDKGIDGYTYMWVRQWWGVYLGTSPDYNAWGFYASVNPTFFKIKGVDGKYGYYPSPGFLDIHASAGGAPPYYDTPGGVDLIGNPGPAGCSASIYKTPGASECGAISDGSVEIPVYGNFASLSITPKELWDGSETGGHGNGGGGGGGGAD